MEFEEPGDSDHEPLPDVDPVAKWSCASERPAVAPGRIREIHVYDFDNTLFKSPAPNPRLWDAEAVKLLIRARYINNSSWWQRNAFLRECGQGYAVEQGRAWHDMWVDGVVKSARKSIADPATLTLLVTGRKEKYFRDLVTEFLAAKALRFDCVILKKGPASNTAKYKAQVVSDFTEAYPQITKLVVYDDRPYQLRKMKTFLQTLRPRFQYRLVDVAPLSSLLKPATEVELVRQWLLDHNHNCAAGKVHEAPMELYRDESTGMYSIRAVQ